MKGSQISKTLVATWNILGGKVETCSKSNTEDPQILDANNI